MGRKDSGEDLIPHDYPHGFIVTTPAFIGVRWPDLKRGPLHLIAHWADVDGRPQCVGFEIWKGVIPDHERSKYAPMPNGGPPSGLESSDLRSIPLASILAVLWGLERESALENRTWAESYLEQLRRDPSYLGEDDPRARLVEDYADHFAAWEQEGRRRMDDEGLFRQVAAVYLDAFTDPAKQRAPTKAVQEHFSVSHSTATKWVRRARQMGFLGETTPGKAGGLPSPPKKRRRS